MEEARSAFSGSVEADYFEIDDEIRERVYAIGIDYNSDNSEVVGLSELRGDVEKTIYDNSLDGSLDAEEVVGELLEKVDGEGLLNGGDIKDVLSGYYRELT